MIFTRGGSVKGRPDYRRRYWIFRSRDSFFRFDAIWARNWRPGEVAVSTEWSSYQFKSFEHLLKTSSVVVWSSKLVDVWMLLMIICSEPGLNVNIVLWTQVWWTLPRELLFIFLKWIDSWRRQFEVPATRIILLLLFLGLIHAGHKNRLKWSM